MAPPSIVYTPGGNGDITLAVKRGVADFVCRGPAVRHRNLATSGAVETVLERIEFLIGFTVPKLMVGANPSNDDVLEDWATWFHWALAGGSFKFYPVAGGQIYYNCTLETEEWAPARVGPGGYSHAFELRIIPDAQAPADAGEVYEAFYGVSE
jgi:hypothetical protein